MYCGVKHVIEHILFEKKRLLRLGIGYESCFKSPNMRIYGPNF